jgi:hypothetical protein
VARPDLVEGGKPGVNPRERAMLDEIEELKAAHRRWQQRERQGRPVKGPCRRRRVTGLSRQRSPTADRFPAWGHRKLAMLMRVDGHHAPRHVSTCADPPRHS